MKAITLFQPWATLVCLGIKRIETRSWATTHRGPLAIHASQRFPREARALCDQPAFRYALRNVRGLLPLGSILCVCNLQSIYRAESITNQMSLGFSVLEDDLLSQFQFGDFRNGRFAWRLNKISPLPAPVQAIGAQKIWEWNQEGEVLV